MLERAENDRISPIAGPIAGPNGARAARLSARVGLTALAAFLLAFAALFLAEARGQQESGLYVVSGIAIDERAGSELAAKESGLRKAKRQGLKRLVDRLTVDGWTQGMSGIGSNQLEFLIRDIAFEEEKFGGGRYLATVTIRFREEAVTQTLQREGIAYVGMPSRALTVVPIYLQGNNAALWSETNPWLSAWSNIGRTSGLVPLTVPLGDLSDIAAVDVNRAYAGDREALLALARRYGTGGVLVATASPPSESGGAVSVSATVFGPGWAGRRFDLAYRPGDGETLEDGSALEGAAGAVIGKLEGIWKQQNLLRFDQETRQIGVRVPLDGLDAWLTVRRALNHTAPIKEWRLEELTTREARIRVGYVGAPDQLDFALSQAGLRLVAPGGLSARNSGQVGGQVGGQAQGQSGGQAGGSVTTSSDGSVITDTSVLEESSGRANGIASPSAGADPYPWKIVPREGS